MPLKLQVHDADDAERRVFHYHFDSDRRRLLVGRRGGVDVLLPHAKVSMLHASIERRGGEYFLVDEGSTNGTIVDGVRLERSAPRKLVGGERLRIASFELAVEISGDERGATGESSVSVARRLAREVLARLGPGQAEPRLEALGKTHAGAAAPLLVSDTGRELVLGARDDAWLRHASLPAVAALLKRDELGVWVSPREAPVLVDGVPISEPRLLTDGQTLTVGALGWRFIDPAEDYLRRLDAPVAAEAPAPLPIETRSPRALRAVAVVGAAVTLLALAGLARLLWS